MPLLQSSVMMLLAAVALTSGFLSVDISRAYSHGAESTSRALLASVDGLLGRAIVDGDAGEAAKRGEPQSTLSQSTSSATAPPLLPGESPAPPYPPSVALSPQPPPLPGEPLATPFPSSVAATQPPSPLPGESLASPFAPSAAATPARFEGEGEAIVRAPPPPPSASYDESPSSLSAACPSSELAPSAFAADSCSAV